MLTIQNFRVEHLTSGCVTDERRPRFSFALESDRQQFVAAEEWKGVSLKSAVLTVNGETIPTTEMICVPYRGKPLLPFTEYTVHLSAEDTAGERAESELKFETGRMNAPWRGRWISDPSYRFTEKKVSPKPMTFLKKIRPEKPVRSAKLYATALGVFELELNGRKVGEDYFMPGFTSYKHNMQYATYDVSDQLCDNNELIAVVAGGWAVGAFTYKRTNRSFANRQAFLCELRIRYEDGTSEIIGTDESWLVSEEGKYRAAEFYDGEVFDATVDYHTVNWKRAAIERVKFAPVLKAQYSAPVRAHETFEPVKITERENGEIIYDFGQNFAGVIRAELNAVRGQKIVFRHSEILMDGALYTEPLRSAKAEATYIATDGAQTYSPRLTYMGFRYVSVTGIARENIRLTAAALFSDMPAIGTFTCSDERLNRLQKNIEWSTKSNFVDIPTDCPQRDERMGWTGDIAVFARTAAFNFDTARFLEKWLKDVKSEQKRTGGIPMIVPWVRVPMQLEIEFTMAVDFWGDSCVLVPWAEYLARGDLGILRKMYPVMKKYNRACRFWAELFSFGKRRRIWKLLHHYGDWCAPDLGLWDWMRRGKWTATAALANSSAIIAKIANLLGKKEDAAYYANLSCETAKAYRAVFTDGKGKLKKEFQTAYVLPLYFQMFPAGEREAAADHLARLVRENGYRIATGFPGTPYILFALADHGHAEEAFRMLLNEECPSWLYEVKAGATTVWERWDALRADGTCNTGKEDGTGGMVSFNHYAFGAVGDFFYRRIAGIEATAGGYREFTVAPLIGGNLTHAAASTRSPYGEIGSAWKLENGEFTIRVKVPVGTRCTLRMPFGGERILGSGEYEFSQPVRPASGDDYEKTGV